MQGYCSGKLLAKRVIQIQSKSKIPFMYLKIGEKVFDPQVIANIFAEYYQELCGLNTSNTSHPISADAIDSFLCKLSLPSLSP